MEAQEPRTAAREAVRLDSIPEAAKHLGVSDSYVYKRIAAREIRVVELGNAGRSKRRIRQDDLQAFIDARTYPEEPRERGPSRRSGGHPEDRW